MSLNSDELYDQYLIQCNVLSLPAILFSGSKKRKQSYISTAIPNACFIFPFPLILFSNSHSFPICFLLNLSLHVNVHIIAQDHAIFNNN